MKSIYTYFTVVLLEFNGFLDGANNFMICINLCKYQIFVDGSDCFYGMNCLLY